MIINFRLDYSRSPANLTSVLAQVVATAQQGNHGLCALTALVFLGPVLIWI